MEVIYKSGTTRSIFGLDLDVLIAIDKALDMTKDVRLIRLSKNSLAIECRLEVTLGYSLEDTQIEIRDTAGHIGVLAFYKDGVFYETCSKEIVEFIK